MKDFTELYFAIDGTNRTTEKVAAIVRYLENAAAEDAAWAIHFLIGRRPRRAVSSGRMQALAAEMAGIEDWHFSECYAAVGDLAETIALLLPDPIGDREPRSLTYWVESRLFPLSQMDEADKLIALRAAWNELDRGERFVFNKLITGAFRVGVSQELVIRAISQSAGIPGPVVAHRLMGDWTPSGEFFNSLVGPETDQTDISRPYPFCLAHPIDGELEALGDPGSWNIEWKWDGIRAQLVRRKGTTFIWSRGEELITDRFPEVAAISEHLPDGTVLDGEILAWKDGRPMKFMELQRRIGRRSVTKKLLQEVPVAFVAFDLLESDFEDFRERPLFERKARLSRILQGVHERTIELPLFSSERLSGASWADFRLQHEQARNMHAEGFMLKRLDSPYGVGRKKGAWWKWKIDPLVVDAVLVYAQRGSGKRASLYTDYTFAIWNDEGVLVPFAKAYSGLTDEEIRRVDAWIRKNTMEKFGPVRTVKPELVMELAFEGIQVSTRHKSGLAVRFPRISRWRHDKAPSDADTVARVRDLLG